MRKAIVLALVAVSLLALAAPAQARPEFSARVSPLDASTRQLMMGRSWRPGCPVPLRDLRLIRMEIWGFDRRWHRGSLVVHRRYTDDDRAGLQAAVRGVATRSGRCGWSTISAPTITGRWRADNTSAFNCRYRAGICCTWSQHAYGRAIDVNPVENPYV